MTFHDIGDWVVKALAGLPIGLIAKYGYDLLKARKSRAKKRIETAEADVEEAVRKDKIKSSSITTLENQMVAERNSWASERDAKDRTIEFLREENENLRHEVRDKNKKLTEALATIDELRQRLDELADDVRQQLQQHDAQ